ncbi:MAG: hypothetical protein Q4G13_07195 [Moraxella sp.]|nr:hypothetical protein [Moraxella sp.]
MHLPQTSNLIVWRDELSAGPSLLQKIFVKIMQISQKSARILPFYFRIFRSNDTKTRNCAIASLIRTVLTGQATANFKVFHNVRNFIC